MTPALQRGRKDYAVLRTDESAGDPSDEAEPGEEQNESPQLARPHGRIRPVRIRLIHDLLLFARPRATRLQPIEIRPLLLDALGILRKDPVGEQAEVQIDGPDVALTGDSELLRAAFLNLFFNPPRR